MNSRAGLLHLQNSGMWLAPSSHSRMVVHTPQDEETRARLERFMGEVADDSDRPLCLVG